MSDTYAVVMAGYQGIEAAKKDFDELVQLVKTKKVRSEGVILVEHDESGEVRVSQTGDHLGRKGMGWGGGVGVLVGLAAPPLLAATAVGAAAGGIVGKFAKHKVDSGLEEGLGERLKPGTAAIIAIVDGGGPARRRAGAHRLAGQVGRPDGQARPARAEGRPRRGRGQVHARPHRAADPRQDVRGRRRPHDRRVGGRLVLHPRTQGAGRCAQRAARAHRRCRLRRPRHLRWRHLDPQPHPCAGDGTHLQPIPRDRRLLPDPGRDADRPQPPPRRHGRHRRVPRPVPRLHGDAPAQLHRPPAHPQGERLRHRRVRQVAHDPGPRDGRGGHVRPLAHGMGLRSLVGLPDRCSRPVRPDHHAGQLHPRRPRGRRRQALLLPRRHHRQVGRMAPRSPRARPAEAVVRLLLHRLQPRPAPRGQGLGRQVQGPVRRRLGRATARRRSSVRRSSASYRRTRSCQNAPTSSPRGTP